jgi:hypothetical protein
MWALVAQRCAVALSSIVPRLPKSEELYLEVLQASEDAGLPGGWWS